MDELFAPVLFPPKTSKKVPKGVIQVKHKPAKVEKLDTSFPEFVTHFEVIGDDSENEER